MSFLLPGNPRSLRFTGEARALAPKSGAQAGGAMALGKPRVRKPPPPVAAPTARTPVPSQRVQTPMPGRRIATPASSHRDVYRADLIPTPYINSVDAPLVRHKLDSIDDGDETMAMVRDGLDVLPGGNRLRAPRPAPAAGVAPIPHFRPVMGDPPTIVRPGTGSKKVKTSLTRAPLAIWLFAAIVAGVVSYHVAPEILNRLETPAHATER